MKHMGSGEHDFFQKHLLRVTELLGHSRSRTFDGLCLLGRVLCSLCYKIKPQACYTIFQEKAVGILARDVRDPSPLLPQLLWKESSRSKDKGIQGQGGMEEGWKSRLWGGESQAGPGVQMKTGTSLSIGGLLWPSSHLPPNAPYQGPKEANNLTVTPWLPFLRNSKDFLSC